MRSHTHLSASQIPCQWRASVVPAASQADQISTVSDAADLQFLRVFWDCIAGPAPSQNSPLRRDVGSEAVEMNSFPAGL